MRIPREVRLGPSAVLQRRIRPAGRPGAAGLDAGWLAGHLRDANAGNAIASRENARQQRANQPQLSGEWPGWDLCPPARAADAP